MLLAAIICQLVIASVASPYRKYPFVFLLDVGNEELEKTNTEQIRVSIPGGSLAVRYPAVADGDLITHVRVSSIDFGADLKASILDGGPGYKYVVLVFLGNAGVTCDAVITLQTLPTNQVSSNNDPGSIASWDINNSVSQTSDESEGNNSAEDMSDDSNETTRNSKTNEELVLSSSNVDNYPQVAKDEDENEDDSDETIDSHVKFDKKEENYEEQKIQEQDSVLIEEDDESNQESNEKTQEQDSASNEVNDESDDVDDDDNYHAERLQADEGYQSKYNNNLLDNKSRNEDQSLDEDARMYRQDSIYDAQGHDPSGEDPVELDQMFNDEEIHNDSDKFKDSNNNNFDSEYQSAVA